MRMPVLASRGLLGQNEFDITNLLSMWQMLDGWRPQGFGLRE
jgi:hypothetical protein